MAIFCDFGKSKLFTNLVVYSMGEAHVVLGGGGKSGLGGNFHRKK